MCPDRLAQARTGHVWGRVGRAIGTLEDVIAVLKEQLDRAEAGRDAAQQRADGAETRIVAERTRAGAEQDKATAWELRALNAEHDRDQLLASHNRALLEVEGLRTADRARRSSEPAEADQGGMAGRIVDGPVAATAVVHYM